MKGKRKRNRKRKRKRKRGADSLDGSLHRPLDHT